jgi:hypothetical protein
MQTRLNVAPQSQNRQLRKLAGGIRPGHGLDAVHLLQSAGEVLAEFGDPGETRTMESSTFYIYPELSLEIELSGGRIVRLFFFAPSGRNNPDLSAEGVSFGASREQVKKTFGAPLQESKGRKFSRSFVRGWATYGSGIQFDFGKSDQVEVITVFLPNTAAQ